MYFCHAITCGNALYMKLGDLFNQACCIALPLSTLDSAHPAELSR